MRIPYVMSPYGTLMPEALERHRLRKAIAYELAERRTLAGARFVLTTGAGEEEALRKLAPQLSQVVIPLAIDTDVFRPRQRGDQREGRGTFQILSVSRLHPIKRLVELVEAFGRVARSHDGWELVIVGPEDDAGYRTKIEAMAASTGIAKRVRLVGRLLGSDLVEQYQGADVFALPSTSEGLGLSIVEALSVGLPVIATTGAPWAEVVAEKCGWWVDPGVDALATALDQAMSTSEDERRLMGSRARSLASRQYSLDTLRNRLVSIYRDAIASPDGLRRTDTGA
jgi:glycosyltransferase involved in cell wall biosynthesis